MTSEKSSRAVRGKARIAFFGLGRMGLPMAQNLATAGYEVFGVDTLPAARTEFHRSGGQTAEPHQAVVAAGLIITILPDGKAVRSALLDGEQPVVDAIPQGALVVEMSSSSPVETLELAKPLQERGIGLIDAPVSGGVKRAQSGELSIMVGGGQEYVARARPVLDAMGSRIFETGPLGSGHAMKALNNYVSAAGLAAASEALLVGREFGLDPNLMVDVLNASTGRNNSTELKMKQFVLSGAFDSGFALALMAKDLQIADGLAHYVGLAAPFSGCCSALWAEASRELDQGADHTEIFRFLEQLRTQAEE